MSLAASDAEELSDSVTDAALLPSSAPSAAGWMPNFSVSSQNWLKSWEWSGLHQKSPLAAVWTRGSCWVAVRPLASDPRRSSPKFTKSSRDHGTPPTLLASVLPLHSLSLQLTSLKKRSMRRCLFWMSQWLHTFARPSVQVTQDYFSACWTLLCFIWTGGFRAPLYGGPSGLSGQTPLCHGRV